MFVRKRDGNRVCARWVCAWCGAHDANFRTQPRPSSEVESHGICRECLRSQVDVQLSRDSVDCPAGPGTDETPR